MGKVLIATFDDEDEMALDELLLFLKSRKYIRLINTFSNDNYLKYDNLVDYSGQLAHALKRVQRMGSAV